MQEADATLSRRVTASFATFPHRWFLIDNILIKRLQSLKSKCNISRFTEDPMQVIFMSNFGKCSFTWKTYFVYFLSKIRIRDRTRHVNVIETNVRFIIFIQFLDEMSLQKLLRKSSFKSEVVMFVGQNLMGIITLLN